MQSDNFSFEKITSSFSSFMGNLLSIFKTKQNINWQQLFLRQNDLPSKQQLIKEHIKMFQDNLQGKFLKTKDPQTIQIVQKILQNNPFEKQNILSSPSSSNNQTESLNIFICDINKYPKIKRQYQEWIRKNRKKIIAIGGPSAHDQTLMSALIPSIRQNRDISYYCRNLVESNLFHSGLQSHARQGAAMNESESLTGRSLFPQILKRLIFGVSFEEIISQDFSSIDVTLNNFSYFKECVMNEYNGIKQIWRKKLGKFTQHQLNKSQCVLSQQIQKVIEKQSKLKLTTRQINKVPVSMAIQLTFSQNQKQDLRSDAIDHQKIQGIKVQQVPKQQFTQYFPSAQGLLAAFRYIGDYSTNYTAYNQQKSKSKQLGAVWEQNKTLSKVYIDKNKQGVPFACGVQFIDGQFIPADKIHLSLGYKAVYFYENTNVRALQNKNIPVAGVSTNLIFKKTPEFKIIMDQIGSLQLELGGAVWTSLGHNDNYVLMRATNGGNTCSQNYKPSYFLNLCMNTQKVFGDSFIGILSAYGCPRSVNYKNSTQFCKLADGLVISYGKGGTGNTKRSSQAYKALYYLGLHNQIQKYFINQNQNRVNIVKGMQKNIKQSQQVQFYYDNSPKTKKNLFNQYL